VFEGAALLSTVVAAEVDDFTVAVEKVRFAQNSRNLGIENVYQNRDRRL